MFNLSAHAKLTLYATFLYFMTTYLCTNHKMSSNFMKMFNIKSKDTFKMLCVLLFGVAFYFVASGMVHNRQGFSVGAGGGSICSYKQDPFATDADGHDLVDPQGVDEFLASFHPSNDLCRDQKSNAHGVCIPSANTSYRLDAEAAASLTVATERQWNAGDINPTWATYNFHCQREEVEGVAGHNGCLGSSAHCRWAERGSDVACTDADPTLQCEFDAAADKCQVSSAWELSTIAAGRASCSQHSEPAGNIAQCHDQSPLCEWFSHDKVCTLSDRGYSEDLHLNSERTGVCNQFYSQGDCENGGPYCKWLS